MNPFIELTVADRENTKIMINVNYIVCYNGHLLDNGTNGCYIVFGNGTSTRHVRESYEHVNKLVIEFYASTQND